MDFLLKLLGGVLRTILACVIDANTEIMFLNDNCSIEVSGFSIDTKRGPRYFDFIGPYRTRLYGTYAGFKDFIRYYKDNIILVDVVSFIGLSEDEKIQALTEIYKNNEKKQVIAINCADHIVEFFSEQCCNIRLLNHLRLLVNYYNRKGIITGIFGRENMPLFY